MKKKKILVTGAAGFIGFSLCKKLLLDTNYDIIGIDNLNSYYSLKLKKKRLNILKSDKKFKFYKIDLTNYNKLEKLFKNNNFKLIFNFAAQAGVRYSFENPKSYCETNISGFNNLLSLVKKYKVPKLFFASSSSVYGDLGPYPKSEDDSLNTLNIYSLSKLQNELIAKTYSKNSKTLFIGLRFFTIYGEWGRPDMLILKYLSYIKLKKTFELFNYGNHSRDFTYINDAIDIVLKLSRKKFNNNFEIFNICSSNPIKITKIIKLIEKMGFKGKIKRKPLHTADVLKTYGNNRKLKKVLKKLSFTNYKNGVSNTVEWYKKYSNLI